MAETILNKIITQFKLQGKGRQNYFLFKGFQENNFYLVCE